VLDCKLQDSGSWPFFGVTFDPRAPDITTGSLTYTCDGNPFQTQQTFPGSFFQSPALNDTHTNANPNFVDFDLPSINSATSQPNPFASVGALRQMPLDGVPALSLGSSSASNTDNQFFDQYFFSGLSSGAAQPNPNLRVTGISQGSTLGSVLQSSPGQSPAQYLLTQGAFNINTLSAARWAAILPDDSFPFPFELPASGSNSYLLPSGYAPPTGISSGPSQPLAISPSQRQAWAQAIVNQILSTAQSTGQPLRSLSQLAAAGVLPPEVFCRVSGLLQPRGDTFLVHVYATSANAVAALQAQVQRLPTSDGAGRKFQILSVQWVTPHAQ
jgi:hypothetical protein